MSSQSSKPVVLSNKVGGIINLFYLWNTRAYVCMVRVNTLRWL